MPTGCHRLHFLPKKIRVDCLGVIDLIKVIMELTSLSALLPPGLLGLGGVLPILIGQNPFTENDKAKPLLATVAVLLVWLVWLCSLILFHMFLFSQYWAVLAVLAAMICLGCLVRDMIFPAPPPATAPTPEESAATAARARKRMALLYAGGLLCTAVGASILMAMKDWVVIDVKLGGPPAALYTEVSLRKKGAIKVAMLQPRYMPMACAHVVRVLVSQKDFENRELWDYLCLISAESAESEEKHSLYLERSRMAQMIMPGAGVFMEGYPKKTEPDS